MTKYRRLTIDELGELEKEFVDFLVINGIVASDWVKIKQEDSEAAELIIDQFSDVIFEGTMRKVEYLKFVSEKSIKCFQCLANKIVLVGMDAELDSDTNFLENNDWQRSTEGLKVYTTSKPYKEVREKEIFSMIQSGASIADGQIFKTICLAL